MSTRYNVCNSPSSDGENYFFIYDRSLDMALGEDFDTEAQAEARATELNQAEDLANEPLPAITFDEYFVDNLRANNFFGSDGGEHEVIGLWMDALPYNQGDEVPEEEFNAASLAALEVAITRWNAGGPHLMQEQPATERRKPGRPTEATPGSKWQKVLCTDAQHERLLLALKAMRAEADAK